jgi:hypothetical protein
LRDKRQACRQQPPHAIKRARPAQCTHRLVVRVDVSGRKPALGGVHGVGQARLLARDCPRVSLRAAAKHAVSTRRGAGAPRASGNAPWTVGAGRASAPSAAAPMARASPRASARNNRCGRRPPSPVPWGRPHTSTAARWPLALRRCRRCHPCQRGPPHELRAVRFSRRRVKPLRIDAPSRPRMRLTGSSGSSLSDSSTAERNA